MIGDKRRIAYWDSCIFIAWLTDEERPQQEMEGISAQITALENNQLELATSVITLPEVLEMHVTAEARQMFEKQFQRRNFHLVDVNRQIANIGHEIRNHYHSSSTDFRKIETPDALHLASAIFMRCECFYTFDSKLLNLKGKIAQLYELKIEKPMLFNPS